jgi:hypothetical protein
MKIFIDKPNNSRIEQTNGSFQTSTITYNEAGYTYNQAGQVYGGFYGVSDEAPRNSRLELTKPFNSVVFGEKPK